MILNFNESFGGIAVKNQKPSEAINNLASQVHVGMLIPLTKEEFIMTHYD